jgi:hypothetical protein
VRRLWATGPSLRDPKVSGGDIEEATPDPIPNSEVKLFGADGTAREAVWESRTPPGLFCWRDLVAPRLDSRWGVAVLWLAIVVTRPLCCESGRHVTIPVHSGGNMSVISRPLGRDGAAPASGER